MEGSNDPLDAEAVNMARAAIGKAIGTELHQRVLR